MADLEDTLHHVDIEAEQRVGVAAVRPGLLAHQRVAEHGERHLVELQIAAARRRQLGNLGAVHGDEIIEIALLGVD